MATTKRTEFQILRDKAFISDKLLKGSGPTAISLALNKRRPYNLSESQMRYDIKKIRAEWVKQYLQNYDQLRAQELARINKLEKESWKAWSRSRRNKKKVTKNETSMSAQGDFTGTQDKDSRKEVTERTPGDKKFIEAIQWCIEQRCKILGLDAADEIKITWQEKARKLGIEDPTQMKEQLVKEFMQHAQQGIEK